MEEVILLIIPYLPDLYKVRLLSTCSAFRALIQHVQYTGLYDYHYVKHLPFIHNFQNVQFRFSLRGYVLSELRDHEGFNLGSIPKGVTILYWDSDIDVTSMINDECWIYTIYMSRGVIPTTCPNSIKNIFAGLNVGRDPHTDISVNIYYNPFAKHSDSHILFFSVKKQSQGKLKLFCRSGGAFRNHPGVARTLSRKSRTHQG